MNRAKVTRLFITASNKPSVSHPLMLVIETDAPPTGRLAFKLSAQERWAAIYGVSITDVNAGYSYANGVLEGLALAGSDHCPPIVIDPRLGLIDHYSAATARET